MADGEKKFCSYFPHDFKEYYKELNWLPSKKFSTFLLKDLIFGGVYWSKEDDEHRSPSTLPYGDISNLNKLIRDLLSRIIHRWASWPLLVQFWAPITTKEGRSFLTTQNQPFSLTYNRLHVEGLCGYRMICMDSKFDIDLDGVETSQQHLGLPARVFKHRLAESTPNVEYYSITEYSQRDDALRCGVKQSLAFPVFESSTQKCVGVIEMVTPMGIPGFLICNYYFFYEIYEEFEKEGLICSFAFPHEEELDEDEYEAHKNALDGIENMLKMICDVHDLPLALAWFPCRVGSPCRALVDGGILGVSCYHNKPDYSAFASANYVHHLKEGMAVVGRALLSTNVVFCSDVTRLSLTEYPLAHYAREAGLSGCFAICLQSSCTGNDVYVLEFFMPASNKTNENPHASLMKILETMRKGFRTLRFASRNEHGEELHIEEIGIQNGEKLDRVQMPQNTISLPQSEPLQSEVEVMQVDSSDQQSVNAINTGSNVSGTECNNIVITCTQEKSTVKASKRKGNKSGGTIKALERKGNKSGVKIKIPLEDILQSSKMKLKDAVENLQVSKSTLKRACRVYGIDRWPPRNIKKSGCSQPNESTPCVDLGHSSQLNLDDLPSAQPLATIVHTKPHDTMMQDANVVIKAKYAEGNAIKFRLSLSSRLIELQQEVAQRLNLDAGTYYVKYKDEDGDLILIACDGDLRDYMCVSRLEGKTCIVVLLEQKLPITNHL